MIIGHPGKPDGWIPPPEYEQDFPSNATDFHFKRGVLLFDLNTDPQEKNDLSHICPSIVRKLKHKLKYETLLCPNTEPEVTTYFQEISLEYDYTGHYRRLKERREPSKLQ